MSSKRKRSESSSMDDKLRRHATMTTKTSAIPAKNDEASGVTLVDSRAHKPIKVSGSTVGSQLSQPQMVQQVIDVETLEDILKDMVTEALAPIIKSMQELTQSMQELTQLTRSNR